MKIGIIQICSDLNYKINLEKIRSFLDQAKSQGVEKVFLPESFYSMSDGTRPTPYMIQAEDPTDEHYLNIRQLAIDYSISILGGSASTQKGDRIYNRSYNFDQNGTDLGTYDKNNLFSCDLEKKTIDESDIFTPGTTPSIVQDQDLKIGLSICVDIRYPKMYLEYVKQGVNLLSIASAFTVPTGKAHWHVLVRARAIEGQCFVVAPAQWGKNNSRIETFGHSLIIDPWGEVLADAKNGEKLITADIDLSKIEKTRKTVKVRF